MLQCWEPSENQPGFSLLLLQASSFQKLCSSGPVIPALEAIGMKWCCSSEAVPAVDVLAGPSAHLSSDVAVLDTGILGTSSSQLFQAAWLHSA